MEDVKIRQFLNLGFGSSSGSRSGFGFGYGLNFGVVSDVGFGYGSGYGSGSGSGDGCSSSSDLGSSYGEGIISINGEKVYTVDGVQTIIRQVKGNVAKGCIVKQDLTLRSCFIVQHDGVFAHGENLHQAMDSLRNKLYYKMSEEERIEAFLDEHKPGIKYPCSDLYEWHHTLTGSCELGRKQFAEDHGIDVKKDEMTVEEFVELTKNAYGGETIKKLADRLNR